MWTSIVGDHQSPILRTLVIYLIIDHKLMLGFLDFEQLAEFGRLDSLNLANRFSMRLKQAEQLIWVMSVRLANVRPRLSDDPCESLCEHYWG
jgi:hypothetical protein